MLEELKDVTGKKASSQALIKAGEMHPQLIRTIKAQRAELEKLNDDIREILYAQKTLQEKKTIFPKTLKFSTNQIHEL